MSEPNKRNPSQRELLELLEALKDEVTNGRLKSVTFMLIDRRMPDRAIIDSYGRPDLTEIACRKTIEEIAAETDATAPEIARAIRQGAPPPRVTN
jgi:hypothetical protein